ncbi:MAG: SpoIID/LytB domain-containing protein [Desulfotomaculum sp.]|nr:SpoIID/LytB domain-containing protein [Desulfotomaculum sp.]
MKLNKIIVPGLLLALVVFFSACAGPAKKPPEFKEEPAVTLYINETGEKKKIKLEEYLAGVVAGEMEPNWPENALAAQAIVARTFTMDSIKSGKVKKLHGTDVSTSVEEFQAYNPSLINEQVKKAVQKTRGEVIMYKDEYAKGWFSACCGGKTAGAREGLNWTESKTPYLKPGIKDGCLEVTTAENKNWQTVIPVSEVREAIKRRIGRDPGNITSAEIVERGPSGRAIKVKLGNITVSGPELRLSLGSEKMRSTLIKKISVEGNNLVINGSGFGHGVGLCQWGAYKMAKEGRSPEDIIKFYYKNVTIEKLWK